MKHAIEALVRAAKHDETVSEEASRLARHHAGAGNTSISDFNTAFSASHAAGAAECRAAIELLKRSQEKCVWSQDCDGNYETDCGEAFVVENGTLKENKMNYCHNCGKTIEEKAYVEPADIDE